MDRSGGRRTVTHEYPFRDEPFIEDMGRKSRSFQLEGYIVGGDYLVHKNALIDALEAAGPGELVHPSYGSLIVMSGDFRVRESTADGGVARFSIEFIETESSPPAPVTTIAAVASVTASATASIDALSADFVRVYRVDGEPAHALESLTSVVQSATIALDKALAPLVHAEQDLAVLKHDLDALYLDADSLVRQPFLITSRLVATLVSLTSMPLTPQLGVRALLEAYGFTPEIARPPATTATRILEQLNYDALQRMISVVMVVQAAQLASTEVYATYDDAVTTRDAVTDALDAQADVAGDETYAALTQLRADFVRAVPGEASDLPRLVRYTPPETVPSLVLSHRLYGDISRETDLVERNSVERPGFVPGSVEIEVLSRD
jgi:prophage DNA circulation protein